MNHCGIFRQHGDKPIIIRGWQIDYYCSPVGYAMPESDAGGYEIFKPSPVRWRGHIVISRKLTKRQLAKRAIVTLRFNDGRWTRGSVKDLGQIATEQCIPLPRGGHRTYRFEGASTPPKIRKGKKK